MKFHAFIISLIFSAVISFSQDNIDSLISNLEDREIDTALVNDHLYLSSYYLYEDSTKSLQHITNALDLSNQLRNNNLKAKSLHLRGRHLIIWGDLRQQSITPYSQALELYRVTGDLENELTVTLNLSSVYKSLGQDEKAFDLYEESLEKHPNNNEFACIINNAIGGFMKSNGEAEKGIRYYDRSEEEYLQINDPSIKMVQVQLSNDKNRGVLYRNMESWDSAEFYLDKSLQKSIEINDSAWIARNYNSIGIMYADRGLFLESIDMYEKSLAIKRALNYTDGVVTTLTNIGKLYLKLGELKKAQIYLEEADQICTSDCEPGRRSNVLYALSEYYYRIGKHKQAYEYLNGYITIDDSLEEIHSNEVALQLEAKYQNNMHQIEEEKLQAELVAADLREKGKSEQIQRQRNYIILGIAFTVILFGLIVMVIRSNFKRAAANKLLLEKNEEISQKSEKIELQKHEIEIKNQEMLDSITYAKRIQEAILPNHDFFKEQLPNSFIYYQPKEILAGDFYWMDVVGDTVIWAAADCTGHGIPGAMVSVVCHNALNRSVHEFNLVNPGEILDCTRDLVIKSFEKSGMDVKDGMDIALCCWNKKTNKLQYAGANNPLWILRNASEEMVQESDFLNENGDIVLKEIKGDKQPVGRFYQQTPFASKEVELKEGDQLFVFTDGFADQFGGDKGKKLKYKNFKKLILKYANGNIENHGTEINKAFNQWKGDFEQLDDVCVIGVKIK